MIRRARFQLNRPRLRALAAVAGNQQRFYAVRNARHAIALTFDDGPSAANTPAILRLLDRYDAQATFFMVGREIENNLSLARDVALAGHEIGNHTQTHTRFPERLGVDELRSELERATRAILSVGASEPRFARPPFGKDVNRFTSVARQLGMTTALWSIDSGDTSGYSSMKIAGFVRSARAGDVVLMHDGGDTRPTTLAATEVILGVLRQRGYSFATLSDMLSGTQTESV